MTANEIEQGRIGSQEPGASCTGFQGLEVEELTTGGFAVPSV
jgi:hypothetical protein